MINNLLSCSLNPPVALLSSRSCLYSVSILCLTWFAWTLLYGQIDTDTDRQTDRDTHTETPTYRQRPRQRHTQKHPHTDTETHTHTQTETHTQADTQRYTHTHARTHTHTNTHFLYPLGCIANAFVKHSVCIIRARGTHRVCHIC